MTMTRMLRDRVYADLGHGPCRSSPIREDDPRIDDGQDGQRPRSTATFLRSVLVMVIVLVLSSEGAPPFLGCNFWEATVSIGPGTFLAPIRPNPA